MNFYVSGSSQDDICGHCGASKYDFSDISICQPPEDDSSELSEDDLSEDGCISDVSSDDGCIYTSYLYPDGNLILEEDPISWIENNLTHLPSVRRLTLDYKQRGGEGVIGDYIGNFTELTHLTIRSVKTISYLPNIFLSLSNLQALYLKKCYKIQELPPNLGDLKNLKCLSILFCTSLKSLPDSLAKLSKLTFLDIGNCDNLEELPANVGELKSLAHSWLRRCRSIESLPSSVAKLSNLISFKIIYCKNLRHLPANLGELKSLRRLSIRYCRFLEECPSNLNVVHLNLIGCCSIQSLPRGLSNLKDLLLPICITRKLERLENLKYSVSLRHLEIRECCWDMPYVRYFPAILDNLPQLSILNIQKTRIVCLPSSIMQLSKLKLLLLPSHFILETLPYQLDDSIVISVDNAHVRKTWKEIKIEMELYSLPPVRDPSGYLLLTGDPRPLVQNNSKSHSIVILDLLFRCLEDIKDSIEDKELAEVTHAYIYGADLHFDSLRKLSRLESLHLSMFDTDVAAQVDFPVSLRHLALNIHNRDCVLPDSIAKLSNLKALDLSDHILFDSLLENLNLERLKLVDCNMTNIKCLPKGLRHVEIIHTKRFCECNKLGINWNQLVTLETLSVTCHSIKSLPSVAGLHNLKELKLKDCFSIKELPPNMDVMVNLCSINVSGTRIKSLPCFISKLPKLQCLILPKCFQPGSLPLELRNQPVVSFDDTDDKYYRDLGYNDYVNTISIQVDDTTNTMEGVNEVVSRESEEGIISQQQTSSHQLLNQPDATPTLGDSHGREANQPIEENSHHTFFSYQNQEIHIPFESEELTAKNRLLNIQKPRVPSSQHALQPEHMASVTSEIERLPPNSQHDFPSSTGNNILLSENGQNEDNLQREGDYAKGQENQKESTPEDIMDILPRIMTQIAVSNEFKDYNVDGTVNNITNENSHHSIYCPHNQEEIFHFDENSQHALQNAQMHKNVTWVDREVLRESEEGTIEEQQPSSQQLLNPPDALPADYNPNGSNDLIGENSHHAISHSQEMEILCSGVCDEMITDLSSNFQEAVSFGKNSQHTVQDGQMNIINSETEHEITFLNQDTSLCDKRDLSHSGNNLNGLENKQLENTSEREKGKRQRREITREDIQSQMAKGLQLVDAGIELGVSRSTMKRRCRELGIDRWPSSRHQRNKKKVSTESPSNSQFNMVEHANPIGHVHVVEGLDGINQNVLSNHVPSVHGASDNSTPNATTNSVKESTVATQSHTDELAPESTNGTRLCTSSTMVQPDGSSSTFVVKASYNEDLVRVDFSLSSNIDQLKEEIGKKLELEVGKFKIRYQDDDGDLVLVTCISDLENALRLSKSAGSKVVRLSVISKT